MTSRINHIDAAKLIKAKQASKRFALICTGMGITVSVGSFLADFLPHTFFVDKYKQRLQMLRIGKEVPLDENVKELFDSVLDDLKIKDEEQRKKFEPFTVGGFEVYHAGVPTGRFSAVIGLPINFTYKSVHSIDTQDIRIGLDRESLNIYHPAAENLLQSLLLSDKAKKFAIAKEILMADQCVPIYRAIESPLLFTSAIFSAEYARVQWKLATKPFPLTILTFAVSGIMTLMMWFQVRDATNTYFERRVDQQLAELGKDYIEGGIEYYDSILKRNTALRTLLGEYGAKVYKKDGDEVIFIRQKRTPVTHRKKFFSDYNLPAVPQEEAKLHA